MSKVVEDLFVFPDNDDNDDTVVIVIVDNPHDWVYEIAPNPGLKCVRCHSIKCDDNIPDDCNEALAKYVLES